MGTHPKKLQRAIALVLGTVSFTALPAAFAQDNSGDIVSTAEVEEIVVTGANVYRDRTDDINPTLSYDLDFFQRFEPLTVGEMMKRTPGVAFSSDVLEFDGVQMRGLGAEYTQVLINGRPIPGQGADRTFFVDRIPSELVESIEIIRSPSADMSSQSIAGTLNIILKDGATLEGITTRLATTYYGDEDQEFRNTGAAAIAGASDSVDYWLGVNVQERRNPKKKLEEYYDDQALEGFAYEDDTRDGTDSSLNGSVGFAMPDGGELRFNGYYVYTDRSENELVREYENGVVDVATADLVTVETQEEDIDQTSWGLDGTWTAMLGSGELMLSAAVSHYEEDTVEIESAEEFEDGISQGVEFDDGLLNIEDDSYTTEVSYTVDIDDTEVKYGVFYAHNEREGLQMGAIFDIEGAVEEDVIAPYITMAFPLTPDVILEGGVRYDIYDREVETEDGAGSLEHEEFLPSLSLRWDITDDSRFIGSIAQTLRRPEFDLVLPFEEDEEPDDEDITIGNPDLEPEVAWGLDVGYEHRLAVGGMVGINFFYRDIENVIEITDTGVPTDAGGSVFTPQNVGDGTSHGIELDASLPLAFMGLDNTGFYMNYAWMDSEIEDPFTGEERTFRNQPDFVYNISLTQDIPNFGGAGISYQKRGESLETEYEEYVITEYDGNLEFFVEWNILENSVLRLSGTNLLDQEKIEYIRDYGEPINEIQYEDSSPTYTLTWRAAF